MDELPTTRLISGLASLATTGVTREDIIRHFTDLLKDSLGIEKATVRDVSDVEGRSAIGGHVLSTRKHFVDNNLSEYSQFPELIGYSNEGYKSYAAVPIMADGHVICILELLSHYENKFTPEALSSMSAAVLLLGFALAYKAESARSNRLAGYFDAVFNSDNPQMLISPNGTLIKVNKAAAKALRVQTGSNLKESLGVEYSSVLSIAAGRSPGALAINIDGVSRTYSAMASRASETLVYLSLQDISEMSSFRNAMQSIDQSSDAVIVFTDVLLNMTGSTENFSKVLGYDRNIMVGKPITDIASGQEKSDFEHSVKNGEKNPRARIDLLTLGGYPIRMRFSSAKALDGYAIMFVKSDAEKYVQDLREGLDDFISNAAEMVIRVSDLGFVTSCNIATESNLGYTRDELSGKDIRSLYKDPTIVDRDMTYARNMGKPDNSYVDIVRKDGELVPGTQSIRLLTDIEGNREYLVVVRELLTKRILVDKESELQRNARDMKKLRMTGELKSQFIYNISHELKSPLTSIKGYAKLLINEEYGTLNEEQKQYLEIISNESDRLMQIIQQVLDSARLEAQKVKLDLKEVDLKMLGDNPSIQALRESATEKGLKFNWKVDYNVPNVLADPSRLIQIFVNLINNSIKFTEKGSIEVHIFNKTRSKIQCDVIDTGIGISEEDQQKLFKKFYQVPTKKGLATQTGAGTGLGLSITRELVKLHGGDISFKSQLGKGTTFWFTLRINPKNVKQKQ